MKFEDLLGHLLVGITLLIMGYFGWIWKKSLYGRFDETDRNLENIKKELQAETTSAKLTAEKEVADAKTFASLGIGEIKDTMRREIEAIRFNYVPLNLCDAERNGCQLRLIEKIDASDRTAKERTKNMENQLDLILNGIGALGARLDKHLNGHKHSD